VDEKAILDVCERLIAAAQKSGATGAEAVASWEKQAETSLENDDVHTVHSSEEVTFGLRVLVGRRAGFVTANRLDDAFIADAADEACAQAKAMQDDSWHGFVDPVPAKPVEDLWDRATADLGVEATTERALALLDRVKSGDSRVKIDSGSVSTSDARSAIATTSGIRLVESATSVDGQLFGMAVDGGTVASFDYDGHSARSVDAYDGASTALADHFVEKCLRGLATDSGQSFKGLVLLSPDAVAELVLPTLCAAVGADTVRKGKSPLARKLGKLIAGGGTTLIDDARLRGGPASSAFDREGVPTDRTVLVDNGVLRTFLFNHYEARAVGRGQASTGHASGGASSLPGISPHQLEMLPGSVDAITLTDAGSRPVLIVGRYSGSTNPVTGDFSGVAKNSALVDRGHKRYVHETAIAGNVYEALQRIVAVSSDRETVGGVHLLPSLLIDGVSVTAG
jgi:PmbA protein